MLVPSATYLFPYGILPAWTNYLLSKLKPAHTMQSAHLLRQRMSVWHINRPALAVRDKALLLQLQKLFQDTMLALVVTKPAHGCMPVLHSLNAPSTSLAASKMLLLLDHKACWI